MNSDYNISVNNQSEYDNLHINEIEKNDIRFMLTVLLFISFCNPCFIIVKDYIKKCRDKYNILKLNIRKVNSNDNLLLDECSICLEKYNVKEKILQLECNHAFHKKCIQTWLNKNNSCPQCRENII